jgi:hypothetical protein
MMLKTARFINLLSSTLYASFLFTHLWELPNKINQSEADYFATQQIYQGWAFSGILGFIALGSTVWVLYLVRSMGKVFWLTLAATLCQVVGWVIFFMFTLPANNATDQWTQLPSNWEQLRTQWEYSHATNAILNLLSLIALFLAALIQTSVPDRLPAQNKAGSLPGRRISVE